MNIKVNSNLEHLAGINPTKQSRQLSIIDICKQIDDGVIALPIYQRDVSWTILKCVDLFNYQLLGKAPVAPVSFNKISYNDNIQLVNFIDRNAINDAHRVTHTVVDGQQRITTNYKAYLNHDDFRNIVLDISLGKFIENNGNVKSNQIAVGDLYGGTEGEFFQRIDKYPANIKGVLNAVRNKFKSYLYTINEASDLTEDEQIQWFEVLNNAGSKVSTIQMTFSRLKNEGWDIYNYISEYRSTVEASDESFMNLFTPQTTSVSYPVAALNPALELQVNFKHEKNYAPIPSDVKDKQLCRLGVVKLQECVDVTIEALKNTLDFLKKNDLFKYVNRIEYINYLLGYFVYHGCDIFKENNHYLVTWVKNVNFVNTTNTQRRSIYSQLLINQPK